MHIAGRRSASTLTRCLVALVIGTLGVAFGLGSGPIPVAASSGVSAGKFDVVVQTMDSCKSALNGAAYQLEGSKGTFTVSSKGSPDATTVSSGAGCPLQQGNCTKTKTGCLVFDDVPAGDYRLTETQSPSGDSANPDGYAPCEGGSACQWEAADVTVNSDGSVDARVYNMYPNGTEVTWPSKGLYAATAASPIVFHDFGLANPGTKGALCDTAKGHTDYADNWSTGTPSAECKASAATLAACPNSPSPHFPWTCLSDTKAVAHL